MLGVDYWISGWVKEAGPQAKNPGSRFFSLAFQPKDAPKAAAVPREDDMAPTPVPTTPAPKPQERASTPPPIKLSVKPDDLEEDVPF